MKIVPIIISMLGLATAPAAFAQGCCGGGTGTAHAGCPMGGMSATAGHEGHADMQMATEANSTPPAVKVFAEPVQAVYDSYITVQGALAKDSLEGVSKAAAAMAKSIQGDSSKAVSLKVAQQAEALSKAKDLAAARDAFKNLSDSLINHLASQKVPAGVYHVAYCPMAKASWIQTSKTRAVTPEVPHTSTSLAARRRACATSAEPNEFAARIKVRHDWEPLRRTRGECHVAQDTSFLLGRWCGCRSVGLFVLAPHPAKQLDVFSTARRSSERRGTFVRSGTKRGLWCVS